MKWKYNNVFHVEEAKETISDFSQGTVKGLWMSLYNVATGCSTIYFALSEYQYKMTQYNILNVKLSNCNLIN